VSTQLDNHELTAGCQTCTPTPCASAYFYAALMTDYRISLIYLPRYVSCYPSSSLSLLIRFYRSVKHWPVDLHQLIAQCQTRARTPYASVFFFILHTTLIIYYCISSTDLCGLLSIFIFAVASTELESTGRVTAIEPLH